MGKRVLFYLWIVLSLCGRVEASEKIRIVTTTTTLKSLTEKITGDLADVYAVASAKQDIHFVAPSPKDVLKLKKADVFIHHGLDTEPWRDSLLNAAGNPRFMGNAERAIDVSKGIALLDRPASLSRSQGDIHAFGNTHYWLDPENAIRILRNIEEGLNGLYPENTEIFKKNREQYGEKMLLAEQGWMEEMGPHKDVSIVTYHQSWPYFTKAFGLKIAGQIEPKPGIPPSSKHLAKLMQTMKEENVRIVVAESYHNHRAPEKIAKECGGIFIRWVQSVGDKDTQDYISMIDYNIREFKKAMESVEKS